MPDSQENSSDGIRFPHANITAAESIADVLRTTVGPTPRDKLILKQLENHEQTNHPMVPGVDEMVVAADGERILEALPLEHPIAPVIRRMVGAERPGETDIEGERTTDGISSTVLLTAELLSEGETLINRGVHPKTIVDGYQSALKSALDAVTENTAPLDSRVDAKAVARTAMTGNDIGGLADKWADIAVDAANAVGRPTEHSFVVRTTEDGSITDSRLVKGGILDRNERVDERMPDSVENATILLIGGNKPGGLVDPDLRSTEATITTDPEDINNFDEFHTPRRERIVEELDQLNVDVVVTHQGISQEYQDLLIEHGILGIRGVNTLDLRQLSLATGASLVREPTDIDATDLGRAGLVEEVILPTPGSGGRSLGIVFDQCENPSSVAALLRGARGQVADYATIELRKAVNAVAIAREAGVIPGAGAIDAAASRTVRERATRHNNRIQLAVEGFADALESIPATLVHNAGEDHIDELASIRARHAAGDSAVGFVWPDAEPANAREAGVLDPAPIRRDIYTTATEVSSLILKIDDAIDATFEDDEPNTDDALYEEEAEKQEDFLETGEL